MAVKTEKKSSSEKKIKQVDGDLRFFAANGQVIGSIEELSQCISTFDVHILNHHINDERNDFADWVENVFENKTLAKKLRKAKSREELEKAFE